MRHDALVFAELEYETRQPCWNFFADQVSEPALARAQALAKKANHPYAHGGVTAREFLEVLPPHDSQDGPFEAFDAQRPRTSRCEAGLRQDGSLLDRGDGEILVPGARLVNSHSSLYH